MENATNELAYWGFCVISTLAPLDVEPVTEQLRVWARANEVELAIGKSHEGLYASILTPAW